MDTSIIIIIIILIIIVILFLLNKNKEKNKEKYGALMELQLDELPQNDDNNFYPYYPRLNSFLWNEPTRFTRNSAPYLWLTPERNVLF